MDSFMRTAPHPSAVARVARRGISTARRSVALRSGGRVFAARRASCSVAGGTVKCPRDRPRVSCCDRLLATKPSSANLQDTLEFAVCFSSALSASLFLPRQSCC
eukprot:4146674-Pleurochrysis_carterae.AAC.4